MLLGKMLLDLQATAQLAKLLVVPHTLTTTDLTLWSFARFHVEHAGVPTYGAPGDGFLDGSGFGDGYDGNATGDGFGGGDALTDGSGFTAGLAGNRNGTGDGVGLWRPANGNYGALRAGGGP